MLDSIVLVPIFFISALPTQRILILKRGCQVFLQFDLQFYEPHRGSAAIKANDYELV